ncbi:ATP-binding cassette domain-containing protein [bacterium]|nr:ATP-binding cassette domain-containing protein [bacterium]
MGFLRRYLGYIRPYLPLVLISVGASLLYTATSGLGFWLAADFIQALLTGGMEVPPPPEQAVNLLNFTDHLKYHSAHLLSGDSPLATLRRTILLLVLVFFVKNIARYIQTLLAVIVEQRGARDMRNDLYRRLLGRDLAFFHTHPTGELVSSAVNDIEQVNQGIGESFSKLVRDPVTGLLFLLMLISVSWRMTLAAMVIAPLAAVIVGSVGASLKRKSKRTQDRVGLVTARLNETLYGMRIVQAYGGQDRETRLFQGATAEHFKHALRRERLRRATGPISEVTGVMVIATIMFFAGERVLSGTWLTPGDFIRFLVLLFGLLNNVVGIGKVQNNLKIAEGAAERVFSLLDAPVRVQEKSDATAPGRFQSEIRFENVLLRYAEDRAPALKGLNLNFKRGEHIVLVGRSGSGKSSIINLLPRFYDPTDGRILLDGRDLRDLQMEGLRRLFGVVTQEIILFHDTVAANIAYDHPDASREEVIAAARAAHAHHFIEALPKGYDTNLGDLGERLSGGQRQRIAIARAMLRNPYILLLDEPTSALDSDVAEEIMDTLDELGKGRTMITATHRLSSIRASDRVIVLEEGRVIGEGTHDELYAENDLYRELCDKQFAV